MERNLRQRQNLGQGEGEDEESRPLVAQPQPRSNIHGLNSNHSSGSEPVSNSRCNDAGSESFPKAIQLALCPSLSLKSLTVLVVVLDLVMFIVSLSINKIDNKAFLAPSSDALDTLGSKISSKMRHGHYQLWRFFTPMFLHANFMHLLMNAISTMVVGSSLEKSLGFKKMALLYLASGFGGILFSCVANPDASSVGASTAIFGMMGYYLAFLFINWETLGEHNPAKRCSLVIFMFIILMVNLPIDQNDPTLDTMGHLGGGIAGVIMGFVLTDSKSKQNGGRVALVLYYALMLTLFYT